MAPSAALDVAPSAALDVALDVPLDAVLEVALDASLRNLVATADKYSVKYRLTKRYTPQRGCT